MTRSPRTQTRRDFLRAATAAAAVAATPSFLVAGPRTDPMQRIAMTTVVFRFRFPATRPADYTGTESLLTLAEVPEYFADRFGIHNLEFWSLHFDSQSPAYLRDLKRAVERSRSRIVNIQVDQPYNLAAADETERRRSIELVKEWVDVAERLEAGSIRANIGNGEVETSVRSLRELLAAAASRRVPLYVENHGGISTDPDVVLKVLDAIAEPGFGFIADFGNFAAGVDRYQALERLLPRADLISAKTQIFDESYAHTSFDFDRCIRIAERVGFRGIYSAEQWDPSREPRDFERIADYMIDRIRAGL
jgi:sugar phosphate isomerase/epimerase